MTHDNVIYLHIVYTGCMQAIRCPVTYTIKLTTSPRTLVCHKNSAAGACK